MAYTIEALIAEFASHSPGWDDDLVLVDSTPVECGRSAETVKRAGASSLSDLVGDAADFGCCASHSRYFWGFRLHDLFAVDSTPRGISLTSPKVGERDVCLQLLSRVNRTSGDLTVIGDKGYAGQAFEHTAANDLAATIVRPRRKDETGKGPHLAPIRQRIESIFQTCKDISPSNVTAPAPSEASAPASAAASSPSPPSSRSTTASAAPPATSPPTPPNPPVGLLI